MDRVLELNVDIVKDALPSLEIFFDLPAEIALSRISGKEKLDRMDIVNLDFLKKVRKGYLFYYQSFCPCLYAIIDATKSIGEIEKRFWTLLQTQAIQEKKQVMSYLLFHERHPSFFCIFCPCFSCSAR